LLAARFPLSRRAMPEDSLNPTRDIASARAAFRSFLDSCAKNEKLVCLHDSDADGVTAGVLWQRALERLGYTNLVRLAPDRERNAWTASNRKTLADLQPDKLFVLDLGAQPEQVLAGVPTCFIDHHRPCGVHPDDTLITAYPWDPIPNTSLLIYDLCDGLVDLSDLEWIAAIGTLSDLGEKAPFEIIARAKKAFTAKYLKEATALVNAPRRAAKYAPEAAARALLSHASPRELVESESGDVQVLVAARASVKLALDEARKAAPKFAGPVALIQIDSPCQVHPLIAQQWRTRLPKYIVIAANKGYIPGRVNFSARAGKQFNVLEFLRSFDIGEGEGSFGNGHDQASGGSLPVERWEKLKAAMGFESES
jgi:single-stranded-DNA-specific exonuclease